jgi:hypothetical protein
VTLAAQFNFDGSNGSTTLTDGATPANSGVCFGGVELSTAQFAQGSASLRLPGNSGAYAKITAPGSGLQLTGDFTITFKLYRDAEESNTSPLSNPSGSLYAYFSNAGLYWHVGYQNSVAVPIPAGRFVAVGLTRRDGLVSTFVEGYSSSTLQGETGTFELSGFELGRYAPVGNSYFTGYVDQLSIDVGTALFKYAYNPDTLAPNDTIYPKVTSGEMVFAQPFAPAYPSRELIINADVRVRDMAWAGRGRVSGTVKTKGTPNFPTYAKVRLIHEADGVCVAEQWSDPLTGEYSFDYIDATKKYTVLAYDPMRSFRAVVADYLTPSIIP